MKPKHRWKKKMDFMRLPEHVEIKLARMKPKHHWKKQMDIMRFPEHVKIKL